MRANALRGNVVVRLAIGFMIAFVPLSLAWFFVAPVYSGWIFSIADGWFSLDDPVIASLGQLDGRWFAFQLNGPARLPVLELDPFGTFFNVVLLLSLLLAVPRLPALGRLWRAALAVPALAALHVLFIFVQLKAQLINAGVFVAAANEAYFYNWIAVFLGALGQQLLPLLLVAGLTWKHWRALLAPPGSATAKTGAQRTAAPHRKRGLRLRAFFRFVR